MPIYDYPCNERVRIMLRLEDLLAKMQHFALSEHKFEHHSALLIMFQILDLIDRSDLKSDLLQELDRQRLVMNGLSGNPSIAEDVLKSMTAEIEQAALGLRTMNGRIGQTLRDNEWLMGVKQRAMIPGGACEFDVPSYHHWLGRTATERQAALQAWFAPLQTLQEALRVILHILRGSGAATPCQAHQGAYQQMLSGAKPAQMLRVMMPEDALCFPEISANKYAINIRFSQFDGIQKPRPCDLELNFELALCNL
ncbi:MAG: cell division protein ZapD [Methylophilales bacterium]|nr:cell division protein ZapD [Methylophilales bacterium]